MTVMKILADVSIQSAFIITVIMVLRTLLRGKMNPIAQYALWLLPLIRLIFPFSMSSIFSIMNVFPTMTQQYEVFLSNPAQPSAPSPQETIQMPIIDESVTQATMEPQTLTQNFDILTLLFWIWITGIAIIALYSIYTNFRFNATNKRSRTIVEISDSCKELFSGLKRTPAIYISDAASSPCLCGLFKPYILLNKVSVDTDATLRMVLSHELSHYRQKDHVFSLLRCILCGFEGDKE